MSTYPNPNTQAIFYQQYEAVRRDEVVGVLLALFLGVFGAHQFYLRRTGLGILYIVLTVTLVGAAFTGIASFIECFFMPGRVREYNATQAAAIAASLGIPVPMMGYPGYAAAPMPPPWPAGPPMPAGGPAVAPPAMAPPPGATIACPRCQYANVVGARFCAGCGGTL
jgi:TM2 domain-containing membrane protein YozV